MWIIYKVSNYFNDRIYIGITSLPRASHRWQKHVENRHKLDDKFHIAICKPLGCIVAAELFSDQDATT
jgi:predicted GIY-YIG superfamily endonuclease